MKKILLLLIITLLSCENEETTINPFIGKWVNTISSVRHFEFQETDLKYVYLIDEWYWTYTYDDNFLYIDKSGSVEEYNYSITPDTLILYNSNTFDKYYKQ